MLSNFILPGSTGGCGVYGNNEGLLVPHRPRRFKEIKPTCKDKCAPPNESEGPYGGSDEDYVNPTIERRVRR